MLHPVHTICSKTTKPAGVEGAPFPRRVIPAPARRVGTGADAIDTMLQEILG